MGDQLRKENTVNTSIKKFPFHGVSRIGGLSMGQAVGLIPGYTVAY